MFSRWKIIDITEVGLKCDSCDWRDDSVQRGNYRQWLNMPCPKCKANLLTENDYYAILVLESLQFIVNVLFGWINYFSSNNDSVKYHVDMNGTGKIKIGKITDNDGKTME